MNQGSHGCVSRLLQRMLGGLLSIALLFAPGAAGSQTAPDVLRALAPAIGRAMASGAGIVALARTFTEPTVASATTSTMPAMSWGLRNYGQLGDNSTFATSAAPVQVVGPNANGLLSSVSALAGGYGHSLAVKAADQTVWAWGKNNVGQLGATSTQTCSGFSCSKSPVQAGTLSSVSAVAAGKQHSLALKTDGRVWAWGSNRYGQLGVTSSSTCTDFDNVSISCSLVPIQVSGLSGVVAIAAGWNHSLAVKNDGTVWAWGLNDLGELGATSSGTCDNNPCSTTPIQVSSLTGVATVAGGQGHSLAQKTDGTVWAWGGNASGELGNNSTTNSSTPVQASNVSGAIAVAAGEFHSLALKSDGSVLAWGQNDLGQLGATSSSTCSSLSCSLVAIQVSGLTWVSKIAAGSAFNFALKNDGTVWAWGENDDYELSYFTTSTCGTIACSTSPVPVTGLSGATVIAAGADHGLAAAAPPLLGEQSWYKLESHGLTDRMGIEVNAANGNLVLHAHDLQIRGTGLNLTIDRVYNSLSATSTDLGPKWVLTTGRDVYLQIYTDGSVLFNGPTGHRDIFTKNQDGSFTTPPGLDATLTLSGSTYTLSFNKTSEKFTFNSSGQLTADADKNGNQITFTYNADGTLSSIADTQARSVTFTYNTNKFITKITDSASRTYQYGYDTATSTKLISYTDPAGKVTQYAYDTNGILNQITDADGNVTQIVLDGGRRVTSIKYVTNVPTTGAGPTTTYTYNASTSTASATTVVTDADNHQTTYTFDPQGRVTQVKDAKNNITSTTYTSNNNVQRYTDAASKIVTFSWSTDGKNNLLSAQGPTGYTWSWQYTDTNHPFFPSSMSDPQGNTLQFTYDPNGNLTAETDQLTTQNQVSIAYNTNGTVSSTTDVNGHQTTYGYDAHGNLTSITPPSPLGGITIGPDSLSRVHTYTDGKGQTTTYSFDNLDRVTDIQYQGGGATCPDNLRICYTFDGAGNLSQLVDNTGTTSFTYDALNRMTKKTLPNTGTLQYTYDGVGNLLSHQDAGGTVSYAYNEVNLVSTLTEPGSQQTTFDYDASYRRLHTNYPNGVTMAQSYDDSGRLLSIVGTKGASTLTSFSYTYSKPSTSTDTGLRQTMTDTSGNVTTYTYDVLSRLLEAQTKNGSTVTGDYQYTYDGAGNRLSQIANGTTTSYQYNAANELCWVFQGSSTAACASPPAGATTYTLDATGNHTGNSAGQSLSYSAKDQTTSITPAGGSAESMTYSGASQIQRTAAGGTSFAYSILGLMSQTASSSTTYFTRDNRGGLTEERTPDGNRYYYLYDGLGNVVALTDSTGNVVNTYSYDPYGQTLSSTGSVANPWRFGGSYGAYSDSGLGNLLKIGQRYYDPNLGRWTQLDPNGGAFGYANENPINLVDPSGLWYVDYNLTAGFGLGVTGGMILDSNSGSPFFYLGFGLTTPGFSASMMGSPGDTEAGLYGAFSVDAGVAASVGHSFSTGENYGEFGAGWPPGVSAMIYGEVEY